MNPTHFSVARVSVIRADGSILMDDYVEAVEAVTDYLTRFSGIQPGDLDAKISSKPLWTLKDVYLKLKCLIERGCIFIGHGLFKVK